MTLKMQAPPLTSGTRMTADEYFAMPESNNPAMLLDGEYIQLPSPIGKHQDVSRSSFRVLDSLAQGGIIYFAPLDVLIDGINVVQPDLFWIAPDSQTCAMVGNYPHGAPDFVIEILSPGTERYDRGRKFDLYEKHGTREYWLIHPIEQFVEVYAREGDHFRRVGVFGPEDMFASPLFGNVVAAEIFA